MLLIQENSTERGTAIEHLLSLGRGGDVELRRRWCQWYGDGAWYEDNRLDVNGVVMSWRTGKVSRLSDLSDDVQDLASRIH